MLAGIGGLMGVFLAWLVAVLVRTLTPVPMQVPISAVVIGVALSAAVGLFFGIYPARRAGEAGSDRSFEGGSMTLSNLLAGSAGASTRCGSTRCARS